MATASTAKNGRGPRVPIVAALPAPAPDPVAPAIAAPTPNLDAAVLKVQAEAGRLVRNAQGQIQSRTYTYVTLTAVVDEVLPLLVGEQLVWKTFPTVLENGTPGLRYRMTHIPSAEFDEDVMPLPTDPTMQGLGSGITYGRRYALTSYLNLTIDEDDDGATANTHAHAPRYSEATTVPEGTEAARPTARQPQDSEPRKASPSQVKMLWAKKAAARLTHVQFANLVKATLGEQPSESKDSGAAKRWLDVTLEKRLPMANVDDLVARIAHAAAEGSQA